MKKGKVILSWVLTAAVLLSSVDAFASIGLNVHAADDAVLLPSAYFKGQLSDGAQKIYDAMCEMYASNQMWEGDTCFDLVENGAVSPETLAEYVKGGSTLSEDFAAAKDAFDLDHSEAWFIDSSYLCLRVGQNENGAYTAQMGAFRSDDYYVNGVESASDAQAKDAEVQAVIDEIAAGAKQQPTDTMSETDRVAVQVKYVHDQVTKRISYRFENECKPGNEGYIRTLYALVTHEGVCESYARAMQVILTKLDIPTVLVHGIQNSGDSPEMHMWNEVQIGGKWYAVDATWDDPVKYDKTTGKLVEGNNGDDGREHQTYLLVGLNTVGRNWIPSGVVSSGNFEFEYPQVEVSAYAGDSVYEDKSGLHVEYTSMSDMEGAPAGQFKVSFNGKGAMKTAEEDGLYLLIKMYDEHNDGTYDDMDWYYAAAALFYLSHNNADEFFYDADEGLYLCTPTCEYVEFALTTRAPDNYDKYPDYDAWCNGELFDSTGESGFYHGDGSELFAQTDRLYNAESNYEAAPYVLSQTPAGNQTQLAGVNYHVNVRWDDVLYRPSSEEDMGPLVGSEKAVADGMEDDRAAAMQKDVRVRYTTYQLDVDGNTVESTLSEVPEWDSDSDHYVDNVTYHFLTDKCPRNNEVGHVCAVELGCPFDGVEFDFRASDKWADDVTLYTFALEGVVGSRSYRVPNIFEFSCSCPGQCPACYRSQGIDWNLWGMPTLLDNPNDLNLDEIVMQGVDGSRESLAELQREMKVDSMNGRLTLVVEPIGQEDGMSRTKYDEVSGAFSEFTDIPESAIQSSSMYEITFTRICRMIMLQTGQSLRMQLGFPAGYNADSPVVYKAYHFTRNDQGEIISVEEIPVAVTPYGLVILCDSFSPFEIIALDKDSVEPDELIKEHNIVVNTDGNGTVLCDGVSAVGENGFVQFNDGETHTFTIEPKAGYVVDVVSFGGQMIPVHNNSFTLSYDDISGANSLLNVAFVPETVKEAEAAEGLVTAVVPAAPGVDTECLHENTTVTIQGKDALCEEAGYTETVKCDDCGLLLRVSEPTPAKGHSWTAEYAPDSSDAVKHYHVCTVCGAKDEGAEHLWNADAATETDDKHCTVCGYVAQSKLDHVHGSGTLAAGKAATCTEEGQRDYYVCGCGEWFEDENCTKPIEDKNSLIIPAKGHSWTAEYAPDSSDADRHYHVCTVCGAKDEGAEHLWNADAATETDDKHCTVCGYVAESKLDHVHGGGTLVAGKAATCTEEGHKDYYICGCGEWFEDENCTKPIEDKNSLIIPAKGHSWTAEYAPDSSDAVKHYHVCTVCGAKDEGAEHLWNADAATETDDKHCTVCGYVAESKLDHVHGGGTLVAGKAATCTEEGHKDYYICGCGEWFEDENCETVITDHSSVIIPAKGHSAQRVEAKAPSATEDGNILYWYCDACGKYFADEALTLEISNEQTVLKATGQPAAESSTAAAATTTTQSADAGVPPKTGEDNSLRLWLALMCISAAVVGGLAIEQKQRRKSGR